MTVQTKFNKYENDSLVTEKCEQIVLACTIDTSLKGGADKVLCCRASVSGIRVVASDAQAAVSGKLNVKAIYITPEGEPDSIDYVSDFSKTIVCPSAVDGAFIRVDAKVIDVQAATEGGTVKIQTVVEFCPHVVVHREYELLEDAEGAFVKRGTSTFCKFEGLTETGITVNEQYATGAIVEKVLAFDTSAAVCKVTEDGEGALAEGEACVTLVYQSEGKAVQKNMVLPFVQRIEGKEGAIYDVRAEVKDSKLVIGGGANENVFEVNVDVCLSAMVFRMTEAELATDAYCPTKELKLSRMCSSYKYLCKTMRTRERISGSVETGADDLGVSRVVAAFETDNALATVDVGEDFIRAEGALAVCVIYKDDNEDYKNVSIDLPYTIELPGKGDAATVEVRACDITAKVKRDSEIEVTATVCMSIDDVCEGRINAIDGVEEGADMQPCEDAVSIYYTKQGETLWDVAKKLSMSPEAIAAQNPSLGEQLSAGDNVVVYREVAV